MKIFDPPLTSSQKKYIKTILRKGGTIVYPTETAYGLGADAFSKKAIKAIQGIKARSKKKSLPVICACRKMAEKIARFSPKAKELADKNWPGPLTMILEIRRADALHHRVNKFPPPFNRTIAVRVSANPIARGLSNLIKAPLISTSANLSGKDECYSVSRVLKQLGKNKPDLIIDAGRLPKRPPSTIIDCTIDPPRVLRQGEVLINPKSQ